MTRRPYTVAWPFVISIIVLVPLAAWLTWMAWQECGVDHGFWFCLAVLMR